MNNKAIDEQARQERLAYFKDWRAANPDKTKKHRETYWRKKAEQALQNKFTAEEMRNE